MRRSLVREENGGTSPWIVRSTALVNQWYLYLRDRDFVPCFLKFSRDFPDNAKRCLNGHEVLKAQLARASVAFEPLDNGLASGADPKAAQAKSAPKSPAPSAMSLTAPTVGQPNDDSRKS